MKSLTENSKQELLHDTNSQSDGVIVLEKRIYNWDF